MTAGSAKFLRIYYARVREYLNKIDSASVSVPPVCPDPQIGK
jgi:hypothetical protein